MYKNLPHSIWRMFFASAVNNLGNFVFTYFALILVEYNGDNFIQSGMLFFFSMLLYIPAAYIGGVVADRYNKNYVYCAFKGCNIGCLFLATFANESIIKIILIIASFFFTGMSKPAFDGLLTDLTPAEQRKEAYSVLYMGDNWANIVAPLLVASFIRDYNELIIWDIASSIVAVVTLIISRKLLIAHGEERQLDVDATKSSKFVLSSQMRTILVIFCIFFFVYSQNQFTLPVYLSSCLPGDDLNCYSYIMSINSCVVLFATPVISKIAKRLSNLKLLFISGILFSVGFGLYGIMGNAIWFYFLTIIWSVGEVLFSLSLYAYINENVTKENSAKANSLIVIVKSVGMCMGSALMGVIISCYNWWMVWCGVLIISSMATIALLFQNKRLRSKTHS